jgi:hypothetical protein
MEMPLWMWRRASVAITSFSPLLAYRLGSSPTPEQELADQYLGTCPNIQIFGSRFK